MPIRAINDKHYRGVSELYRKSDGQVTGYYVTYRDSDGKPIKRRVEANNRDDALLRLADIKHEVDLQKQGNTMSVTPNKTIKGVLISENKANKPSVVFSGKNMQKHQQIISSYKGVAIVSLIDIVAFDDINILYGYEAGIRIVDSMQELINEMLTEMRKSGLFRKHGIETFSYELYHVYADKLCLFIKNDFNHRLLDFIVKELLTKISNHKFIVSEEGHIHINATIGATKANGSVSLIYAEKALHEAKKFQNSYIFHDSYAMEKNEHIVNKVYETLVDNINEETVIPYFQGIFATADSTVPYKFESLMRILDNDGRVLPPAVFMEKSKDYRLYTQLMIQMIDKVFAVIGNYDVSVTLNLSYIDINNTELCDKLMSKIKKMKIGKRLTVEIVESEQIQDLDMVNEFIFALKKNGVMIAIDDFGSGFSNFDTILNLDIDYVKLDGSLVSKIHEKKYRIMLESMVKICHDLGIKTIAEYICDESIMEVATIIGVDYLQGYHLHQPSQWDSVTKTFGFEGAKNA
jgi:EAL domain-containing protein (putative c-di-GMP-specific phosphodiesterase class I)